MGDAITLDQLEEEIRRLFGIASDAGRFLTIDEQLPFFISISEGAKDGIDQALDKQRRSTFLRQPGEDYFIADWHGDIYTGLRERIRELTTCNDQILKRLQEEGIELEGFLDFTTIRMIKDIQKYTRGEVDKALAVGEEGLRSRLHSPAEVLAYLQRNNYLERSGDRTMLTKKFLEDAGQTRDSDSYTIRVLRLVVEERGTGVTASQLMEMDLIPEYEKLRSYSTLIGNMKAAGHVEAIGKEGTFTVYGPTEKGILHYRQHIDIN